MLPWPGLLRTVISPPSISAIRLLIANPRPVPPKRRLAEPSTWENGSEQQAHLLLGHADARIGHVEYQLAVTLGIRVQPHHDLDAADLGELDGIADEVDQDLPQADRIGRDPLGNVSPDLKRQRQSLCIRTAPSSTK